MIGPYTHPSQLLRAAACHEDISRNANWLRVLSVLSDSAGGSGTCYLADATIAEELGISRWTVSKAIKSLEAAGFIQAIRGAHRGRATTYVLPQGLTGSGLKQQSVARSATLSASESVARSATLPGADQYLQDGESVAPTERKRGASRDKALRPSATPSRSEPIREPGGSKSRPRSALDHMGQGRGGRPSIPTPPDGATLEELVRYAAEHGHPAGRLVIDRMAARFGLDPTTKGGLVGKYLWPVADGKEQPDRLCQAARWADKALEPGMEADKPPLDGFLLMASGHDVSWPVAEGSEEAAARARERHRPRSSADEHASTREAFRRRSQDPNRLTAMRVEARRRQAEVDARESTPPDQRPDEGPRPPRSSDPTPLADCLPVPPPQPLSEPRDSVPNAGAEQIGPPVRERRTIPMPASWGPSQYRSNELNARRRISVSIEELAARAYDDPIIARELARRRPDLSVAASTG